jgi:hypothetical protein
LTAHPRLAGKKLSSAPQTLTDGACYSCQTQSAANTSWPLSWLENLTHIGKLSYLFDYLISNLFGFYPLMARGQEFFQLAC